MSGDCDARYSCTCQRRRGWRQGASSDAQVCPAQPALQTHLLAVQLPEREQSSSVAQAWPGAKSTYY